VTLSLSRQVKNASHCPCFFLHFDLGINSTATFLFPVEPMKGVVSVFTAFIPKGKVMGTVEELMP